MTVFTIGYEGVDLHTFLSLLSRHGIDTIVDIRELPLSRKPGFSKKALAKNLNHSGVEYLHMAELGCPKPIRIRYRADDDWARYTKDFRLHLLAQQTAVLRLADRVCQSNHALLCFEADYNFCHRSMVAEAIRTACGASINHIKATETRAGFPDSRRLALV